MPTLDDAPTLEQLATVELDASNAGAADKILTFKNYANFR